MKLETKKSLIIGKEGGVRMGVQPGTIAVQVENEGTEHTIIFPADEATGFGVALIQQAFLAKSLAARVNGLDSGQPHRGDVPPAIVREAK